MLNYVWFFLAALFEIAGCYGFWMWLRQGKSAWWMVPAMLSLALFALLLTKVEAAYAGRAYAAYGGIYIITSIAWLAAVEKVRPLATDWIGVGMCVIGATIILLRIPRSSGHPFHEHLTTDSTLIRPPIPRASGH